MKQEVRSFVQPRVPRRILSGIVWIEVDEAAVNQPVADLEHIAPAAGAPLGIAGAPGPVRVLAVARSLAHDLIAAGEDPVEFGIMVRDGFDGGAHVAEEFSDLFLTPGHAPLREVHQCVGREQVDNGAATRRDAAIVETLQIFNYDLLALFVGH
jgi:hypothetical protein